MKVKKSKATFKVSLQGHIKSVHVGQQCEFKATKKTLHYTTLGIRQARVKRFSECQLQTMAALLMVMFSAPGVECWPAPWRGQRSGGAE